jgi:hypothetical protein
VGDAEGLVPKDVASALRAVLPGAELETCTLLRQGGRNAVYRCVTREHGTERALIAKRIERDETRGLTDWASHAFLASQPTMESVVPPFVGGDPRRRIFFLEAIPDARSLEAFLGCASGDGDPSELLVHARALARLHVATAGAPHEFDRARRVHGVDQEGDWTHELIRWRRNVPGAMRWLAAPVRGRPIPLDAAIDAIIESFGTPGPFLTFTHGDIAPSNVLVRGTASWLVDFEYGGYRHALYDATAWHILCPLPEDMLMAFGAAYREGLASELPECADPTVFAREWARVAAYRAIALLSWLPIEAREWDRPWVDNWSVRNAVLTTLDRASRFAYNDPSLEVLSESASVAAEFFAREWGCERGKLPAWR